MGAGASRQNAFGWRQVLVPVGRDIRIHTAASCSILQLSRAWMQPAALHTSSLFTRPMHMQGRLPMGNTQQQGFFRVLLKCVKGEIIGQSGRWAVRVPRASIPEMIATSRSHLTAELKLPDGHYVVQTGARHAGRMPMSYLRRDATKPVMNVHLRPAPMPKTSTMHRNVDTSVRYTGIGLRSARARPGGGGGAPENTCGPRGRPEPHPRPAHPAGAAAYQIRTPCGHGPSMSAMRRALRVLGRLQLPQGVAWGSQDTRAASPAHFIDTNQQPSSQASCPAHGHYGTAPGAAVSQQGCLWAVRGTQEILGGPPQASETHPSTP